MTRRLFLGRNLKAIHMFLRHHVPNSFNPMGGKAGFSAILDLDKGSVLFSTFNHIHQLIYCSYNGNLLLFISAEIFKPKAKN